MSDYINLSDVIGQLQAAGLDLNSAKAGNGGVQAGPVYVESSKSIRVDTSDKPGKKSGAYRLHELRLRDGIWLSGSFWIDNGSTSYKIELNKECPGCGSIIPLKAGKCANTSCDTKLKPKAREIPKEEIEAHRLRLKENQKQAEIAAAGASSRAAAWAAALWRASQPATPTDHDYFTRKHLTETGGARIFAGNEGLMLEGAANDDYAYLAKFTGALIVPLMDTDGKVHGVQFILSREKHADLIRQKETDKVFWPYGLNVSGTLNLIGGTPHAVCLVAEGYATAISLHLASNLPVAIAWNAGNLPHAVAALRKRYKKTKLLVCADDDWLQRCAACQVYTPVDTENCAHCGKPHGKANAGIQKARQAVAATHDAAMVKPVFSQPRPPNKKGPTDFNDLHAIEGIDAVRVQIETAIADLAPNASAPSLARGFSTEGEGESNDKSRRAAVSIMGLDDIVERFIYVDDATGEFAFDTWTKEIVKLTKVIKLLPARVRFDDVKDHPIWRGRAVYIDQIGFDPGGDDKNILCNRWNGWPTKPRAGSCTLQLELLEYLCSNEPTRAEIFHWILCWMAWPLKHPGAKMKSAIVIHGPQGTGKSMVFESYAKIYGEFATVLNQGAIEDKFNADWSERKLFILADEIVARAEMHHLKNQLKNFITGEWVRVNPKNVAAHRERNHMNILFSSNEDQPVVLENDDRRHLVIWTPPKLPAEFYAEVQGEIETGGTEALHHYLLGYDIGDWKPWHIPPMTHAKLELIQVSADSIERFIADWMGGDIPGLPFCPCGSSDLYAAYRRWCKDNGEAFPRNSAQFGSRVGKRADWFKGHKNRREDAFSSTSIRQRFIIPSKTALFQVAEQTGNRKHMQENESDIDWLTRCYLDFNLAIGGGRAE